MTDLAIVAKGVGKVFSQAGTLVALENIHLEIPRGAFVSLLGPSGCGKSTLLRLIGDLTEPSQGEVLVNGQSAHTARLKREYGMVFQQATLYDWRTVLKNVELPLEVMGYPRAQREARAQAMLQLVQLEAFAKHYPWQLSGGMQQRVALARALAFEPSVLLMDEPFGALDEMTREQMQLELLRLWRETHTTVVFVTHSIPEAVFLSTQVVVMSARPGRIVGQLPIDLPQPRNFETREDPHFFTHITAVRECMRQEQARPSTPRTATV